MSEFTITAEGDLRSKFRLTVAVDDRPVLWSIKVPDVETLQLVMDRLRKTLSKHEDKTSAGVYLASAIPLLNWYTATQKNLDTLIPSMTTDLFQ